MIASRLIFFFVGGVICTSLSCVATANSYCLFSSIFDLLTSKENSNKDKEQHTGSMSNVNTSDINIPQVTDVEEASFAKIKVLDVNSGRSIVLNTAVGTLLTYEGVTIILKKCLIETAPAIRGSSKALMLISHLETRNTIFYGWIFSKSRAVAQPIYKKFFFSLVGCYHMQG